MTSPPLGTIRGKLAATGGYRRNVSSITAFRYFNGPHLAAVMSLDFENVVRSSLRKLSIALGFLVRKYIHPDSVVADVSLPAMEMLVHLVPC